MNDTTGKKSIVIAEDDPGIQDSMLFILRRAGYEVIPFSSGSELLDSRAVPDLFILDRRLPGADGLDICRLLKSGERTRGVPVLMLSASPDIIRFAKHAGADDALEKPFSIDVLRKRVAALLA